MILKTSYVTNTMIYFVKYSFRKYPARFFFSLLVIGSFYFSIMIKLSEQPVRDYSNLSKWQNSAWHIFVTMLTIGFGDTTPYTYWGRFFSVLCGIFGFGLFSLMIISFNKIISFGSREKKILNLIGKVLLWANPRNRHSECADEEESRAGHRLVLEILLEMPR